MKSNRKFQLAFKIILVLFFIYAGAYIFLSSFVVGGERYFVLNDDAMISMRYAHNLARGEGLVWNPGELVEGISNPLWTFYMAFWHLLPISASKMSLPIQITGLLLLTANLFFVRKIALYVTKNEWITLGAVFLTAFYEPLIRWSLLGMEVSALVLILNIALWQTLQASENGEFDQRPYILLGLSTFIRIEMAVPLLLLLMINLYFDESHRRKHITFGITMLIASIGLQSLLRFMYFGEWLPNTYYLKITGIPLFVRIGNGLTSLLSLVWNTGWLLALLPFSILLFRRDRVTFTLSLIFLAQLAYSVYVGGDAWEHKGGANRYISIVMPLFFILLAYSAHRILEMLIADVNGKWLSAEKIRHGLLIAFVLLTLMQVNSTLSNNLSISCCPPRISQITSSGFRSNINFAESHEDYVRTSLALMSFTTPEASIAIVAAGTIPYFTDLPAIDLLGKSDTYIARLDSQLPNGPLAQLTSYRPGHSKWDYSYSLGELQPDIVVQLWDDADQAQAFLQEYSVVEIDGLAFKVKNDSPNILWEKVTLVEQ